MREYRIFKTDLWFGIYKKDDKSMRFLGWRWQRTLRKDFVKNFYNREDAISALVVIKKKDDQTTD